MWEMLLSLKDSVKHQKVVAIDAKNNLVDVPDKIVALIGVDDLCIVQTKDALLITRRDDAKKFGMWCSICSKIILGIICRGEYVDFNIYSSGSSHANT